MSIKEEDSILCITKKMKEAGLILDNYRQILDANRDGLWKKHPMRVQKKNGNIISTQLRFSLHKNES